MSARTEELEARLEANRAEREKAEDAQYEIDLEKRIELETEHGGIAAVKVSRFVPGQPTRAYLRTPTGPEYKRYKALMFAANQQKNTPKMQVEAQEQLARSCWIYPAKDDQDAMLAAFPGILSPLSMAAAALAEGKTEDEGKG